jgi:arginine exporter protein ArgO
MPLPASKEQVLGGHMVLAVGYQDSNQVFIIRNSWGQIGRIKVIFTCLMHLSPVMIAAISGH